MSTAHPDAGASTHSTADNQLRTVGIRLEAPMQSWALHPRGGIRSTHTRPTKSAVIGLIANALGRDFSDPIDDLAALRFGVRVDWPGVVEVDYHTTGGGGRYHALPREVTQAPSWWGDTRTGDPADPDWMNYAPPRDITEGKNGGLTSKPANANITTDQYLAGASFLAAVEGTNPELIHQIAAALAAPARALFLGRKAYGPSAPLLETVSHQPLEDVFASTANHAIAAAGSDGLRLGILDVYLEPLPGHPGHAVAVPDQPLTFNGPTRRAARLEIHYTLGEPRRGGCTVPQPATHEHPPRPAPQREQQSQPVPADSGPTLFDDLFDEGGTQ